MDKILKKFFLKVTASSTGMPMEHGRQKEAKPLLVSKREWVPAQLMIKRSL